MTNFKLDQSTRPHAGPVVAKRRGARLARAVALALALVLALDAAPAWSEHASVSAAFAQPVAGAPVSTDTGTPPKGKMVRPSAKSTEPYAPVKRQNDVEEVPEIDMFAGESRIFPTPGVARIAAGNRQVINAEVLDEKDTIIFANAPGATSLYIWNGDGRYQRLKVNVVAGDTARYAREVAAFLSNMPNAKTSVVGDKVIVEGDELSDADRDKVAELAKRYAQIINFTSPIGWEQTVMMDVKVVEFPKTELRELGLKWAATGGAAVGAIWTPGGRGDQAGRQINIITGQGNPPPIVAPGGGPLTLPSALTLLSAVNLGINAQLNLLEQKGSASILAEPQLSTRSGFKASFLAGGEFPYSVSSVNGVTIIFKPYGIKLDIEPRIGRNGVIRAVIEAEVSAIDASLVTTAGPALLSRKTKTEFNVKAGETIVLSGLIQRSSNTDIDKVPLLGDIPVLGALFRSKRFQNKETELVVFVTPSIVDSRSPGLVERIDRANGRLDQNLGERPHLTDPLQPGVDPARVTLARPAAGAAPEFNPAAPAQRSPPAQ